MKVDYKTITNNKRLTSFEEVKESVLSNYIRGIPQNKKKQGRNKILQEF